jgi:bifunctional oligoribonuclease and PAP phosphatase NrnA
MTVATTAPADLATIDPSLLSLLLSSEKVLCVSHVAPDGDAVGSLIGMGWLLRHLNKEPVLALQDQAPDSFAFLPGYADIIGPNQVEDVYDLIVCLDASSPDRMGRVYRDSVHAGLPLLVIDHHITNTFFGTHNWVEPLCAATCQMVVYLADALDVPLQGNLAKALLTGIVTDTLCFRTSNTDGNILQAAMRLVDGGASITKIVDQTLQRTSFSMVRLWGEVLQLVHLQDGVIWLTISVAQRETAQVGSDASDGLANHLITVDEADISATFTEKTDETGRPVVECSFRAKEGFDVSGVAFSFGGGGHPPASGCTIPGLLAEVSQRVVAALQEARTAQLRAAQEERLAAEQVARGE